MKSLTITRKAYLARQAQIKVATQGLDLLEQKRAALMRELMRTADHTFTQRDVLEESAAEARRALALAEALAGETAVRSASMAAQSELPLDIQTTNVIGVTVPVIEHKQVSRSVVGRGYALGGTPAVIDEAAAAYEEAVEELLALAESELRLKRLASEIQRTTRQANGLEFVVIPRLLAERDAIKMALSERERAEHFRLKRAKKARARKLKG